MSIPGWYPDPAGEPHRFRYWFGEQWSEVTTDDPYLPPPPMPVTPASGGRDSRKGLIALVAAALALLLIGGGIGGWLLTRGDEGGEAVVSSQSREHPSDEPEPEPSPSDDHTGTARACPQGDPKPTAPNGIRDGRVHGGGLSFAVPPGYQPASPGNRAAFAWLDRVSGVERTTESYPEVDYGWVSSFVAGAVGADDYASPEEAALAIVGCMAASPDMYRSHESDEQVSSRATTINGHDAWEVRHEVHIDDPVIQTEGDHVVVVVVDLGDGQDSYGVFVGFVPLDDEPLMGVLDRGVTTLRVE